MRLYKIDFTLRRSILAWAILARPAFASMTLAVSTAALTLGTRWAGRLRLR
jgi:hypothetical protein